MTGRWTDLATWAGPTINHGGPMVEQRGVVLHIAEGTYEGTIAWQKNPAAQVSSHFVVDTDGTIAQVVEVNVTAWTQIAGNGHWLSVENAGHTPHALTAAQVEANARLLARAHREFGVPLQVATAPSGRGLGHHSMGAENGVNWGHGDCPGPAIIAQKPAIVARALQLVTPPEEDIVNAADFLKILQDPAVAKAMRALPWQYVGGGIPADMSTLGVLNAIYQAAGRQTKEAIAAAVVAALPPTVRNALSAEEIGQIGDAVHAELGKLAVTVAD